jgi:hypothetical protein
MSDATLMTGGEKSTAADQQQGTATTQASAGAEGQGGSTTQATEGQTAQTKTVDGENTEGDKGQPQGAPEKYEFTMPEGVQMDESGVKAFSEFAKDSNLSQDAAQALLSKMAPAMAQRQADAVEAARTEWANLSTADKEIGGDKLTENLAVAKKALDKFGTPELSKLLNESGLGNHPEIIRVLYRAGKAISEDTFVGGGGQGKTEPETVAQRMYPNMNP